MKRWMTALAGLLIVAAGSLTASSAVAGDSEPAKKMDDATSVLQKFVNIPENKVPQALLRQAYGVAVIPSVFRIGFIGGLQRGKGVLSVRTSDGEWSDPTFITLTGGSFGFQAGISSTDIILVFKSRRSVERIANGQFSLGGDASVAAGPVGRSVGASTNLSFNAEVYSYARSRGLFAGVSVNGARLAIDKDANWLFYNQAGIDAHTVLDRASGSDLPKSGRRFVYTLNQYMPSSDNQFDYRSNTNGSDNDNDSAQGSTDSGYTGAGSRNSQGGRGDGQTSPYQGGSGNGVTVQQGGGDNGKTDDNADTSDYSGHYGSASHGNGSANDDDYGSQKTGQGGQ